MAAPKTVTIEPPPKSDKNIEATKYFIFNETGNIMMASTIDTNQPMSDSTQRVFAEVSVFFAAMSRAITTTTNPNTGKHYSLYNYNALENIISGSGLFVHVTEQDVKYETSSFGVDFSTQLLQALLGLATGAGAMSFASAMISSMGDEGLRIAGSKTKSESKVANIVFVCEYLLGMPIVSAIVVYADCKMNKQSLQVGPCFRESSTKSNWILHKDTYLFVTPTFIHEYAGDLDSINSDPQYLELIRWLRSLLTQTPDIFNLVDPDNPADPIPSGAELSQNNNYELQGQFLPTATGTLEFSGDDPTAQLNVGAWSTDSIRFTITGTQADARAIDVMDAAGARIAQSPGTYTVA